MDFEIEEKKSLSEQYSEGILKIFKIHYPKIQKNTNISLKFALMSLLDEYEQLLNKRGSDLFQPENQIFSLKEKKPN